MSISAKKLNDARKLRDLKSVGSATILDFRKLGISMVSQLKGKSAEKLYRTLCEFDGIAHDICAQDVFSAAIAQANDPNLSSEKSNWWYWSKIRKSKSESNKS
jgi:hypothetical protein